jgi:hypothetical protein
MGRISADDGRGVDSEKGEKSGEESGEELPVENGVEELLGTVEEALCDGTHALMAGFPMSVAAMYEREDRSVGSGL